MAKSNTDYKLANMCIPILSSLYYPRKDFNCVYVWTIKWFMKMSSYSWNGQKRSLLSRLFVKHFSLQKRCKNCAPTKLWIKINGCHTADKVRAKNGDMQTATNTIRVWRVLGAYSWIQSVMDIFRKEIRLCQMWTILTR